MTKRGTKVWKCNIHQQLKTLIAIFQNNFTMFIWDLQFAILATETDKIGFSYPTVTSIVNVIPAKNITQGASHSPKKQQCISDEFTCTHNKISIHYSIRLREGKWINIDNHAFTIIEKTSTTSLCSHCLLVKTWYILTSTKILIHTHKFQQHYIASFCW